MCPNDAEIVAFAKNSGREAVCSIAHNDEVISTRLQAIEWDFATAKTDYLTHNLHPYPAKFIPQIPNALIEELSSSGETVADIFCGSGTTLLEALQLKHHAIGIDANPLAVLISKAKTTPLAQSEFEELAAHRAHCQHLLVETELNSGDLFYTGQPFQSAGWRPDPEMCQFWFKPHVVEELAELRRLIDQVPSKAAHTLCAVVFSAIIVAVSKQDSDTRYVRREKQSKLGGAVRRYLAHLDAAISAVRELTKVLDDRSSCRVLNANILEAPETEPFDLVITSPPYPNAYSYHLYHRTRLLWLGYEPEQFKRIEIGSHRKYSAKGRNRATAATFSAEFEQIFQWLRNRLRDHRHACFVIGDSTLNGARIDNASLIAEAGATVGFREIARIQRSIAPTRKAFNPKIGKINTENILILQKV